VHPQIHVLLSTSVLGGVSYLFFSAIRMSDVLLSFQRVVVLIKLQCTFGIVLPTRTVHSHVIQRVTFLSSPASPPPTSIKMSTSTSKAGESSKPVEQKNQETLPNLGVLEEDDEFEEFAVAGQLSFSGLMI
jgi:hypothetical protein